MEQAILQIVKLRTFLNKRHQLHSISFEIVLIPQQVDHVGSKLKTIEAFCHKRNFVVVGVKKAKEGRTS